MAEPDEEKRAFWLGWSACRRAHQALAPRYRKVSRTANPLSAERQQSRIAPHAATLCTEGPPLTDGEWEMVEPLLPHKPPPGRPYNRHTARYPPYYRSSALLKREGWFEMRRTVLLMASTALAVLLASAATFLAGILAGSSSTMRRARRFNRYDERSNAGMWSLKE
jgi:hypothetical protein